MRTIVGSLVVLLLGGMAAMKWFWVEVDLEPLEQPATVMSLKGEGSWNAGTESGQLAVGQTLAAGHSVHLEAGAEFTIATASGTVESFEAPSDSGREIEFVEGIPEATLNPTPGTIEAAANALERMSRPGASPVEVEAERQVLARITRRISADEAQSESESSAAGRMPAEVARKTGVAPLRDLGSHGLVVVSAEWTLAKLAQVIRATGKLVSPGLVEPAVVGEIQDRLYPKAR